MTIYKKTIEDLKRYTFVSDVNKKNNYIYIFYKNGKKENVKKISYRANAFQLEKLINKIKDEIGYKEIKKKRDILVKKELKKPMIFADIGEDDG